VWYKDLKQLFKSIEGTEVHTIRASTLARYFWCSIQAWLMAGGLETPRSEALSIGSKIHSDIETARKLSPREEEFQKFLSQYLAPDGYGGTIGRPWINGETVIQEEKGWVRTHGMDDFKVDDKRRVVNIEYKTSGGWKIYPTTLMPAIFQTKIYQWIMEPYLLIGGYHWKGSHIVWLKRLRNDFKPIGETTDIEYDSAEVQEQIDTIFNEWNRASEAKTNEERRNILIAPKKFKCTMCSEIFKSRCPFQ